MPAAAASAAGVRGQTQADAAAEVTTDPAGGTQVQAWLACNSLMFRP
jgi:hypothetical protein